MARRCTAAPPPGALLPIPPRPSRRSPPPGGRAPALLCSASVGAGPGFPGSSVWAFCGGNVSSSSTDKPTPGVSPALGRRRKLRTDIPYSTFHARFPSAAHQRRSGRVFRCFWPFRGSSAVGNAPSPEPEGGPRRAILEDALSIWPVTRSAQSPSPRLQTGGSPPGGRSDASPSRSSTPFCWSSSNIES